MIDREDHVLAVYEDLAHRCWSSGASTAAVHWLAQDVHASVQDNVAAIAGQLECEWELIDDEQHPQHYDGEDVVDYADWVRRPELVNYFATRVPFLWMATLYESVGFEHLSKQFSAWMSYTSSSQADVACRQCLCAVFARVQAKNAR